MSGYSMYLPRMVHIKTSPAWPLLPASNAAGRIIGLAPLSYSNQGPEREKLRYKHSGGDPDRPL